MRYFQLSASSAALDLAPLSQTPPRNAFLRGETSRTSEWPQFTDPNSTNTASTTGGTPGATTTATGAAVSSAAQQKSVTGTNTPIQSSGNAASRLSGDFASTVLQSRDLATQ